MSSERPDAPAAPAEKQLMSNPGETLREARAERKMSQLDIAQNLKISVAAVDGIENGLYDRLPGDTFARGYIRSYARINSKVGINTKNAITESIMSRALYLWGLGACFSKVDCRLTLFGQCCQNSL